MIREIPHIWSIERFQDVTGRVGTLQIFSQKNTHKCGTAKNETPKTVGKQGLAFPPQNFLDWMEEMQLTQI